MSAVERLRTLANALPEGGAVTLTRRSLLELAGDAEPDANTPVRDMTVEEAAGELGLAASTVRAACAAGKLRAYRRGRRWWVPRAGLREYAITPNGERDRGGARRPVDLGAWRKAARVPSGLGNSANIEIGEGSP